MPTRRARETPLPKGMASPIHPVHGRLVVPNAVRRLLKQRQTIRLDLGCGAHKQGGTDVIGLDMRPLPGVDIVCDLEDVPWPLPANCARVAFISHYLEHIKPWKFLPVMAELHRVMTHDGQVLAAGPYGVEFRYVQDPTHCNPINEATFCYWDPNHPSGLWQVYEPPAFHLESFEIIPAGSSRDFNAILRCCKGPCEHEQIYANP